MGTDVTEGTSWNIGEVRSLLRTLYPQGRAWSATVAEEDLDAHLPRGQQDQFVGCRTWSGIAVDLDGDRRADRFLYGSVPQMSVTARNLQTAFRTTSTHTAKTSAARCAQEATQVSVAGFPFDGQFLPDTHGKITALMFVANRDTAPAFLELVVTRPDIQYHILYADDPEERPAADTFTDHEQRFFKRHAQYLPDPLAEYALATAANVMGHVQLSPFDFEKRGQECDWFPSCGFNVWIQDPLYLGVSPWGARVVGHPSVESMDNLASPVVLAGEAVFFSSDGTIDAGDLLSTARHLFLGNNYPSVAQPHSNFLRVYAAGKQIIPIDRSDIKSANHLDMLVTPTETYRAGRQVVLVARPTCLGSMWLGCAKEAVVADARLQQIAQQLETLGFSVERLPYVYTGHHTYANYQSGEYEDVFSFHNILMEEYRENGHTSKRVYMPWYEGAAPTRGPWYLQLPGLTDFSRQAQAIYESLGYEVIPIHGLANRAKWGGALRCVAKVTDRRYL